MILHNLILLALTSNYLVVNSLHLVNVPEFLSDENEEILLTQDPNFNKTLMDDIYQKLMNADENALDNRFLQDEIQHLVAPWNILQQKDVNSWVARGICTLSVAVFEYIIVHIRLNWNLNIGVKIVEELCTIFSSTTKRVCQGVIELNKDFFIYIIKTNQNLTAYKMSSIIFQNIGCCKEYRAKWSVEIPTGVSLERFSNNNGNNFYRIIQISDIHIDALYKVGGNSACKEPLCCQIDQGEPSSPANRAGKWGDYNNCDMPYHSFNNLLDQIKEQNDHLNPKISYIYFTGDIISHRIWETSRENNSVEITKVIQLFKEKFKNISIYPILGNHEPHPEDIFSPLSMTSNNLSTIWIFDLIAEQWSDFLPTSALNTVRQGGYYTVLVQPGFRIVSLNSNVCYIYNWWLLYNETDPYGQLQWLVGVLQEAEKMNESVHILSHVGPGDRSCIQEWTRQYKRIVTRFSNTITGQFYGHTHLDEFRVFFNDKKEAINVAYNGGSFTTYSQTNPNYRIYEVDTKTHELLDFEEWIYDLNEANQLPDSPPRWFKLYNFRSAYNVSSLKPKDVEELLERMKDNGELLQTYFRYKSRNAEPAISTKCEEKCEKENFCSIVSTEADEAITCISDF